MSAECKSCGAAIVWGTTEAGKKMPFNAQSAKGWLIGKLNGQEGMCVQRDMYVPHWAVCPDAASHRKR